MPKTLVLDVSTIMARACKQCPVIRQAYGRTALQNAVMVLMNINIVNKGNTTSLESYYDPLEEFMESLPEPLEIAAMQETLWMELDFELTKLSQIVHSHLHTLTVGQWIGMSMLVTQWVSDTCVILELE